MSTRPPPTTLTPFERASFFIFVLPLVVPSLLLAGVAFNTGPSSRRTWPNLQYSAAEAWGTARFSGLTIARYLPPEADHCSGAAANNTCPPPSATDAFWAMCESCLRPIIAAQLRSARLLAGCGAVLGFVAMLLVPLHSSGLARRAAAFTPQKRQWIAVAAYAVFALTLGLAAGAARLTVGATQSYAPIANTPFRGYPNSTSMGAGFTTASEVGGILTAAAAVMGLVGAAMLVAEVARCVCGQRGDGGYGALSAGGA